MPRPKLMTDEDVLDAALGVIRDMGPEALSFGRLSAVCGLSGAALVQRFGSKEALVRAALLQAWDGLDRRTAELDASTEVTRGGAVEMLVALSDYGGIERHADGLRVLREDFRDPALRARGRRWVAALEGALDRRLGPGLGRVAVAQWQGIVTLWGFDPELPLAGTVRAGLEGMLARVRG